MFQRLLCLIGLHDWQWTGQGRSDFGERFVCSGCHRCLWRKFSEGWPRRPFS